MASRKGSALAALVPIIAFADRRRGVRFFDLSQFLRGHLVSTPAIARDRNT
ncbi:MAG: hypothetical protein IIB27_09270 [Chloroflexi bacterium]|nr:hypothetical protein [Chloroflexota bacterium]